MQGVAAGYCEDCRVVRDISDIRAPDPFWVRCLFFMMPENLLAHNPVCLPVLVDDSTSTEMIDRKQTIRFIYYSISTLSSVHFEDCFLAAIRLAAMLERFSRNDTGMQYAATIEETESTK